ncbi:MAG: hypothetical protein HY719_07405 [Planctomycetes bacterium]|nr:hypothetical protein [Planctomycetota bacterium]
MRIITLTPFYRESRELTAACLANAAAYADAVAICVNDAYDPDTEDFLRSFPIVKNIAFVNKDRLFDPIYVTSLLTLAQALNPDWIVRQDVDEEFDPTFVAGIRALLATTDLDAFALLWPSYVGDASRHCFYHHALPLGMMKQPIHRFDLRRLYVPGQPIHVDISMFKARVGVLGCRQFHKNLLKSDQENYTKFITSGRKATGDDCVDDLEKTVPEALRLGAASREATFAKKEHDQRRLLPFCFRAEPTAPELEIVRRDRAAFDRAALAQTLAAFYPAGDAPRRLATETPAPAPPAGAGGGAGSGAAS